MTHERRTDDRMLQWLESGPTDAPLRALETGIAYARAHPRRRLSRGRLVALFAGRVVLPGAPAVPGRLRMAVGVGAMVAAVAVIGGWVAFMRVFPTADDSGFRPLSGEMMPAPTVATAPVVVAQALQECVVASEGVETPAGGVTETRGTVLTCAQTSSDPRLTGTLTLTSSMDVQPDLSAEMWGRAILRTEAGSWSGAWTGTSEPGGTGRRIDATLLGTGSYGGLRWSYSRVGEDDLATVAGTIEQAAATVPDGVPVIEWNTCALRSAGTTSTVDGLQQTRGMTMGCTSSAGDPRIEGAFTLRVDTDQRSDGTTAMRGTGSLVNDDGGWTTRFEGTVAVGYTTHRLTGTMTGWGRFTGLEYRYTLIGTPETLYVMRGAIAATD